MRKIILLVGIILLLAGIFVGNELYRGRKIEKNFGKIASGDTEASVQRLLGKPSSIEACNSSYAVSEIQGCSLLFVYRGPFSPLLPAWNSVYFDQSGRVITAESYQSP